MNRTMTARILLRNTLQLFIMLSVHNIPQGITRKEIILTLMELHISCLFYLSDRLIDWASYLTTVQN